MTFPSNPNEDDLHEAFGRKLRYRSGKWQVVSSPAVATVTEEAPKTEAVAQAVDLPMTGNEIGAMVYVQESNRLYVWNGSGWFEVALVNTNPTITAGGNATYELATDGTPTVVTLTANDPEGVPITWSYTVTSGALGGTTVSNVDNVFTITPSIDTNDAGTFQLTFTASDGVNVDTSVSSFSLVFGWSGDDLLLSIDPDFVKHPFPDPYNPDHLILQGAQQGKITYHKLGEATTIWRKMYSDPFTTFSSNSAGGKAIAYDPNYIYYITRGKTSNSQISPGANIIRIAKSNGNLVPDSSGYLYQVLDSNSVNYYRLFGTMNAVVDTNRGLLYIAIAVNNGDSYGVYCFNANDLTFNWARGKSGLLDPNVDFTNAVKSMAIGGDNVAIINGDGNYGTVLDVLSYTGAHIGSVKLGYGANGGAIHYYSGKYYCWYNSGTQQFVSIINATTLALEKNVYLTIDGANPINRKCNIYANADGVFVGTDKYFIKLDLDLNTLGAWLLTTNGSTAIAPHSWSFANDSFYVTFDSGSNLAIAGGPLSGSMFGVQKDTFNLVPVSHSSTVTTPSFTYSTTFTNIASAGYVGYSIQNQLSVTSYTNYNVS